MSQSKDLAADLPKSGGRKEVDWEAIERDYRAGILTLRAIAGQHGITAGRISQVAKAKQWTQDLRAKIAAKTQEKVNKAALNEELNAKKEFSSLEVVEANAQMQADIILSHRKDVPKARKIVMSLLDELGEQTENKEMFERLGELMANPDEKGVDKLNEIYRKVIGMSGRVDNAKKLSDAIKTLVGLEREVFDIGADRTPGQNLDDFLDALA